MNDFTLQAIARETTAACYPSKMSKSVKTKDTILETVLTVVKNNWAYKGLLRRPLHRQYHVRPS